GPSRRLHTRYALRKAKGRFIGFWLPDDATGLIEVSYQGRTGTTEFSTTDDGATCVTDLRLT
ncbi:MAG: hypothetical protein L0J74_13670, partial [Corynebacterium sp.]|nr:hypothetical protein [Corynebacterium sp.]MDN6368833.1 hypothetical protein [Corynebacterium sp.]MDN6376995.1 hypothetical protein [Corynebacterium sp.]MDN6397294.1 hypothetical protein [Corynebacterium sp.]MDN6405647.1 hypothetical protein [Corynebacterium sp.]